MQLSNEQLEQSIQAQELLAQQGQLDKALDICRQTINLCDAPNARLYGNYGVLLYYNGEIEKAKNAWEVSISIDPSNAVIQSNLGAALQTLRQLAKAEFHYKEAIKYCPTDVDNLSNLGTLMIDLGKPEEAITLYKKALKLDPTFSTAHSNLLFAMHYSPQVTNKKVFMELEKWRLSFEKGVDYTQLAKQSRHGSQPLSIGFISANFRKHPVGYFTIGTLENLSRLGHKMFAYSDNTVSDEMTQQISSHFDTWRDITAMSDENVTQLVRNDHVDVIIDLCGHTAGSRLGVILRGAAPLQIKWVGGQFGSTGLETFDGFITDQNETQATERKWFAEKELVFMPDGYVTYTPPDNAPDVNDLPYLSNNYFTFGCFNNPAKINEKTAQIWSKILRNHENSMLVLVGKAYEEEAVRKRFVAMFEKNGISASSLSFHPQLSHDELMALYGKIDIALDSYPYSGGLTTCESLWMGVPVLSLKGHTFAGRHAASHLHNAGLSDWVAPNEKSYHRICETWTQAPKDLAKLRSELRNKVAHSTLCDHEKFAKNFSAKLEEMWERK